jgi:hypothetical protein
MWIKYGLAGLALFVASAAVAFGVVGLGGGSALAQIAGGDSPKERYDELLAQKLGISVTQLQTAQKAAHDQMIDDAVAAGRLTAEQAAKLKSAEPGKLRGLAFGRMKGAAGVGVAIKNALGAAAEALGMTPQTLWTEIQTGKSLADIAEAKGTDSDELTESIVESIEADLQQAVTNGRLTQAQADRLTEGLEDRIAQMIERERAFHGPRDGARPRPNQP